MLTECEQRTIESSRKCRACGQDRDFCAYVKSLATRHLEQNPEWRTKDRIWDSVIHRMVQTSTARKFRFEQCLTVFGESLGL